MIDHDPLCEWDFPITVDNPCHRCALLAKVRADERENFAAWGPTVLKPNPELVEYQADLRAELGKPFRWYDTDRKAWMLSYREEVISALFDGSSDD